MISVGRHDAADFRIQITHPDEAVPLDSVYNVVAHAEANRTSRRLPDPVELFVSAVKSRRFFRRWKCFYGNDILQFQIGQRVDPGKAESGAAELVKRTLR